jgi:hypothetical protein
MAAVDAVKHQHMEPVAVYDYMVWFAGSASDEAN